MNAASNEKLAALYPAHLATVRERHDRALAAAGYDHAIIAAGSLRTIFLDDMYYPFRVNAPFKAWVPVVDNPNCFVVYTPGRKPQLVYWLPVDYWYKPAGVPTGYWVEQFDVKVIAEPEHARDHFPKGGRVAFIGESDGMEGSDINPEGLMNALHWERSWKTDYEIECIRQANRRAVRGHLAAEKAFRAGESEFEIHVAYLRATQHTDDDLPYGNIIALNENAAVLHYMKHEYDRLPESQRHSFLIDAGATVNGYASDITRTYSAKRDEFQELIDAMDAMQQGLVAAVKPGADYPGIHMLANKGVAEVLLRFGVLHGLDADAIVEKQLSNKFLPHGVGHFLGLQVHDVAGFMADASGKTIAKPEGHPYLRLTRRIEPRMLFTIEPGLYFIEPLMTPLRKSDDARYVDWNKVDGFMKYGGIRVEDDILVTPDGHENLTRDAFAAA